MGKKIKLSRKIRKEIEKQGIEVVDASNGLKIVPPDKNVPTKVWHMDDQHIGATVDYLIKECRHLLDFEPLKKLHKRFNKATK